MVSWFWFAVAAAVFYGLHHVPAGELSQRSRRRKPRGKGREWDRAIGGISGSALGEEILPIKIGGPPRQASSGRMEFSVWIG